MHWINPDHLPRVDGALDRCLFNPHGDVDGFLMADGMEVHVPPHRPPMEADRIGAWPERGLLDTQLGPNRKGKKW